MDCLGARKQQKRRSACASMQSEQRLCYSLIRNPWKTSDLGIHSLPISHKNDGMERCVAVGRLLDCGSQGQAVGQASDSMTALT